MTDHLLPLALLAMCIAVAAQGLLIRCQDRTLARLKEDYDAALRDYEAAMDRLQPEETDDER